MTAGILGTALSGLMAAQGGLTTTSNNISNVNTEGYSRQRTEQATRREQFFGGSYVGNGVDIANITRSYDQFITGQVRSSSSAFGEVDKYYELATQIDSLIATDGTSLAPAMKNFFNAVHEVADDPSSIPARQVMLSEGESLALSFNTLSTRFSELRDQVNNDMDNMVNDLNAFASEIANLNVQIVADMGRSAGDQMPNDLLDKRDLLLNKIAKLTDLSVVPQQDGSISVFIGKGQPLVMGNWASPLATEKSPTDATHTIITMNGQDMTNQLSGGSLYGSLRFRDEILDPAQQQIGVLAAGLALEFNRVHQQGYDLFGQAGLAFFDLDPLNTPDQATVMVDPNNLSGGTIVASYQTPPTSASTVAPTLVASDYRLDMTTATDYTLTRLVDSVTVSGTLPFAAAPNTSFGFDLSASGAFLAGDSFLIRPTYNAAANLRLNPAITDPKQIAAAGGNIPGPPVAALPGDNRNALALAQLETSNLMFGTTSSTTGTATFDDAYGQMVSSIGTQTHSAKVSRSAQDVLLKQATASWESTSGVNLDEEAANLIKFQNAYQASAQAISVANSLFDTLIGAFR